MVITPKNNVNRELYEAQQKMPLVKKVEKTEQLKNNANKHKETGKFIDIRV